MTDKLIRVKGKVVGEVILDRFFKTIKGSQHILRYPQSIAFDEQSLREVVAAGATEARITDSETGIEYVADILSIYANGFRINRGHGDQIALPLHFWTKIPPATQKEDA